MGRGDVVGGRGDKIGGERKVYKWDSWLIYGVTGMCPSLASLCFGRMPYRRSWRSLRRLGKRSQILDHKDDIAGRLLVTCRAGGYEIGCARNDISLKYYGPVQVSVELNVILGGLGVCVCAHPC